MGWRQIDAEKIRGGARLVHIRNTVKNLIEEHKPTLMVLEGYAYGAVGKAFEIGELGGCLKALFAEKEIQTITPAPGQVKKFICGDHMAEKQAVIDAVNEKLHMRWTMKDNNVADASAMALLGIGFLDETKLDSRHALEVVRALKRGPKQKAKKKSSGKKRFPNI